MKKTESSFALKHSPEDPSERSINQESDQGTPRVYYAPKGDGLESREDTSAPKLRQIRDFPETASSSPYSKKKIHYDSTISLESSKKANAVQDEYNYDYTIKGGNRDRDIDVYRPYGIEFKSQSFKNAQEDISYRGGSDIIPVSGSTRGKDDRVFDPGVSKSRMIDYIIGIVAIGVVIALAVTGGILYVRHQSKKSLAEALKNDSGTPR